MVFNNRGNLKICCFMILLVLLVFSFASFPINAQSNDNVEIHAGITPDNLILWGLDIFIERIQLLLTFNQTKKLELRLEIANERLAEMEVMFAKNNTEAAEKAEKARTREIEIIGSLGVDNATKINVTEKPIEEEKPVAEIADITNITCGYCRYLVNGTCLNYTCCEDDECKANEYCSEHECVALSCESCQYIENRECVDYECCADEDCEDGYICVNHGCIDTELECSYSCDDRSNWTIDYCNTSTGLCEHIHIIPYCGNQKCEMSDGENEDNCPEDCEGVLEALYCEEDSDCVPCCAGWRLLENGSYEVAGRTPHGTCINQKYTYLDVPTICRHTMCGRGEPPCIECNKCVDNQCVTTYVACPWD